MRAVPRTDQATPRRSRFARNVWQVARANVLAQALPLLAAPLLTRLYSPADFGAVAQFAAVLGIGLSAASARFDWSVPNARSAAMAAAVLALGGLVLAGVTMVALLAAALWAITGGAQGSAAWAVLGAAVWLLPPALLGGGLQQLLAAWHVRAADLTGVGRAKMTQSAANVAVALAAAPLLPPAYAAWGLAGGVLAGQWVGLRTLWRSACGLRHSLARTGARRLAVAWARFGVEAGWSTLVSVLNTASFALVPLLLARHYSADDVGFYALVQRVALAPVGLVGAAVSQSFWAEAATLVRSDKPALRRLYQRSTRRLLGVAAVLALLAASGPWTVGPLFGAERWGAAGTVLAACVPMLIGQVVVSPLSHLVIHRRQHWQAVWDAIRALALAAAIEAGGRAGAPLAATVLALSVVMAAMYAVLYALNLRALRAA